MAHLADEGALAVHAVVVIEADRVEAGGDTNSDDLGEAARVGDIDGADVVRFWINKAAWMIAKAAGGHVSIAVAELVLVASDGVALREGRHHQCNE